MSETGLRPITDRVHLTDFSLYLQTDDGTVYLVVGHGYYEPGPLGNLRLTQVDIVLFRKEPTLGPTV